MHTTHSYAHAGRKHQQQAACRGAQEHYDALALGVYMNGGCSPATTYAALCGVRAFLMNGVRWCASLAGTQRAAAWRSLPQAGKAHA
jgi:hypothetical protein